MKGSNIFCWVIVIGVVVVVVVFWFWYSCSESLIVVLGVVV